MNRTELISKIKELNISTERPAHQMKTEVLEQIVAQHGSVEVKIRGRKPNPDSARQQRLALKQMLLEQGVTVSRGRKTNPTSARQQRLELWAAKRAAGEVVKRGRPKKSTPTQE